MVRDARAKPKAGARFLLVLVTSDLNACEARIVALHFPLHDRRKEM
jgi:hypothetical protein